MALANYFAAQSLIMQRISDNLFGFNVLAAPSLEVVFANSQLAPCVNVVPYGEDTRDERYGSSHEVSQRWLLVLVVKNVNDISGKTATDSAGETLMLLHAALNGWQPSDDHGALVTVPPPLITVQDGFGYFPLVYRTDIEIPGVE
jgi:hypothetical protein